MDDFDRWVDEFVWAPDSQSIYFTGADEGEEPIFQFDLASGQRNYIARRGEYGDLH